ncbi:MAG: SGNH/GDSL hydrolase family protein [Acetobacteraceae bacterium]|nr:SGNH/GDSL hydrolase family protein [Acetobacteraceae bacterium]MBV8521287.1 SGNH/GDSL hydrolase family protein [Acetobacteraceae bacterium]MBV8592461.1 SGNH/GDSL hydrolase family protein [Acetobacteraceae bacterium]
MASDATITPETLGQPSMAFASADPASYSGIYAFGASLVDAGNIYRLSLGLVPASPPYSSGRFSNGPVWVQDLAAGLGLPPLGPSVSGGTDFAFGGAETGTTPVHTANLIDLPFQLTQFNQSVPNPNPNALYVVSAGSDDLLDMISAGPRQPSVLLANIASAVGNESQFISGLAARGAKNVLVLNVPDLGKTPRFIQAGIPLANLASAASAAYDTDLSNSLGPLASSEGLNLKILDAYTLLNQAIASPQSFGFIDVRDPVWTGNFYNPFSGTLLAATPQAQNQFLFWDSLHPTAQGHALLAAAAFNLLNTTA